MNLEHEVIEWFKKSMVSAYPNSEWIYADEARIYIRHINHLAMVKRLVLANVEVYDMGKGTFKSLLGKVEQLAKETGYMVVAECVHNAKLFDYLVREGYTAWGNDPHTLSKSFD